MTFLSLNLPFCFPVRKERGISEGEIMRLVLGFFLGIVIGIVIDIIMSRVCILLWSTTDNPSIDKQESD